MADISQAELVDIVQSTGIKMQCPVRLGINRNRKDMWTLPLEPVVSVKASKTITRRNIAKAIPPKPTSNAVASAAGLGVALAAQAVTNNNLPFGTVKELWSLNDYEITVEGFFISDTEDKTPTSLVAKLNNFLKRGQSIIFSSWLTETLGIELICVADWEFPATPGVENQAYTFSGYSDFDFELL